MQQLQYGDAKTQFNKVVLDNDCASKRGRDCQQKKQTQHGQRCASFPLKLHQMLDQAEKERFAHIVSWLPGGKIFKVFDQEAIIPILKKYFRQTRFKSFVRQLQIYEFSRVCRGGHRGECSHPLFVRSQYHLLSSRGVGAFQTASAIRTVGSALAHIVSSASAPRDDGSLSTTNDVSSSIGVVPVPPSTTINTTKTIPTRLYHLRLLSDRKNKQASRKKSDLRFLSMTRSAYDGQSLSKMSSPCRRLGIDTEHADLKMELPIDQYESLSEEDGGSQMMRVFSGMPFYPLNDNSAISDISQIEQWFNVAT
jgi:hypothetical protein